MSRGIPVKKGLKTVAKNDVIKIISDRTKISRQAVGVVYEEIVSLVERELIAGNSVQMSGLCTFYLRRRDYSDERRKNFHLTGKATLPAFCYYPYALMSSVLRNKITENKDSIADVFNDSKIEE